MELFEYLIPESDLSVSSSLVSRARGAFAFYYLFKHIKQPMWRDAETRGGGADDSSLCGVGYDSGRCRGGSDGSDEERRP